MGRSPHTLHISERSVQRCRYQRGLIPRFGSEVLDAAVWVVQDVLNVTLDLPHEKQRVRQVVAQGAIPGLNQMKVNISQGRTTTHVFPELTMTGDAEASKPGRSRAPTVRARGDFMTSWGLDNYPGILVGRMDNKTLETKTSGSAELYNSSLLTLGSPL